VYERAIQRERAARERAEALLESKALELYHANQALREQHARVQSRNDELERAHAALQKAQAQLIQSEKLASVGLLAAGVAHEINNPMAFIISNLGSLQGYGATLIRLVQAYQGMVRSAGPTAFEPARWTELQALEADADTEYLLTDVSDLIKESLDGAARVRDIVQGLKSFSRVDAAAHAPADLHAGLDSTLKVVANELKYKCTVDKQYGQLPLVPCHLAQINQVFMNLLVNAAQAIKVQGTITLRTWVDAEHACVEVRDTGCGIPADQLGSIFDPFFTTKPVGSGTGLGLAISYGIVEDHGGRIDVQSEPGVGTAFTLRLPLAGGGSMAAT
jgi:signal transduction histidine kinase